MYTYTCILVCICSYVCVCMQEIDEHASGNTSHTKDGSVYVCT